MMSLFDEEQIMKAFIKSERHDEARETAERMIRKGKMSLEEIADYVPSLTLEELKELEGEVMYFADFIKKTVGLHGLVFCFCHCSHIFVAPADFVDFQELFFAQTGKEREYSVALPFIFVFFQILHDEGV